jgi:hypothetical protein
VSARHMPTPPRAPVPPPSLSAHLIRPGAAVPTPKPITIDAFTIAPYGRPDAEGCYRWRLKGPGATGSVERTFAANPRIMIEKKAREWLVEQGLIGESVAPASAPESAPVSDRELATIAAILDGKREAFAAAPGTLAHRLVQKLMENGLAIGVGEAARDACAEIVTRLHFVRLETEPADNIEGALARVLTFLASVTKERAEQAVAVARAREEGRKAADAELRNLLAAERATSAGLLAEVEQLRASAAEAERRLDVLTAVCLLVDAKGDDDVVAALKARLNPTSTDALAERIARDTERVTALREIEAEEARLCAEIEAIRVRRAQLFAA